MRKVYQCAGSGMVYRRTLVELYYFGLINGLQFEMSPASPLASLSLNESRHKQREGSTGNAVTETLNVTPTQAHTRKTVDRNG